ncbi:hypothetical protein C8R44DRAFT_856181 [Mycena epipterygia]|nr:hypothetical protein C8R44DRAFT_856181 [Mycena epipterygia]
MLSLFRLRALPVLRLSPRAPGRLSASLLVPLRAISSTRSTFAATCLNCHSDAGRREGHLRKQCREPTICVACGVEGHQRRDCPSPDPARLEALKTAPIRCFRCGENGHAIKHCTKPQTCYGCKQPFGVAKMSGGEVPPTPGADGRVPDPCAGSRRFLSVRCVGLVTIIRANTSEWRDLRTFRIIVYEMQRSHRTKSRRNSYD